MASICCDAHADGRVRDRMLEYYPMVSICVTSPDAENMLRRPAAKQSLLWVICVLSALTALYAAASMAVYSWLDEIGRWPADTAARWTGAHLLLLIAVVVFLFCVVNIIALRRRTHKD